MLLGNFVVPVNFRYGRSGTQDSAKKKEALPLLHLIFLSFGILRDDGVKRECAFYNLTLSIAFHTYNHV